MIKQIRRSILSRRGSESIETILIFLAGISLLATAASWSYYRYILANQGINMALMHQTATRIYEYIHRAYSRGDGNTYPVDIYVGPGDSMEVHYNPHSVEIYYNKGDNRFTLLKKRFRYREIEFLPEAATLTVKGNERLYISTQGGRVVLEVRSK